MRSIVLSLLALASCRYLSTHQGVETCESADGAFVSCSGNSKFVCQDSIQVLVDCGGVCVDNSRGQGCEADLSCGDGFINPLTNEECDDGNTNQTDECRNCQNPTCGDGVEDNDEECDDKNQDNTDACIDDCKIASCGDGFVLDLNGNGQVNAGDEECDDDNTANKDGCDSNCKIEFCGDGIVNRDSTTGLDECDDGDTDHGDENSDTVPDACRTDCSAAHCGDGVTDSGEECDDGNQINTDDCTNACESASCGDNFIQAGVEECDGGNSAVNDGCGATCQLEFCGDGLANDVVEVCDDVPSGANEPGTTGCNAACSAFDVGTCGAPIPISPPPPAGGGPPGPPPLGVSTTLLNNLSNTLVGNIGPNGCAAQQSGKEQVFAFNSPPNGPAFNFTLKLTPDNAARDMSLYIFIGAASCGISANVTDCADDNGLGGEEIITSSVASGAVPVFIVVDSKNSGGEGSFQLLFTPN
jgi:cysteine-rich repeat protein